MGSSNSTPSNLALHNGTRSVGSAIQVTSTVINRLEEAKRQTSLQNNATQQQQNNRVAIQGTDPLPSPLQIKAAEMEHKQFLKTLEKLESLIGNPILWAEQCAAELKDTRDQLIRCHIDYPQEPLRCDEVARQYQSLIFGQQYKTILRVKQLED